MAVTAADVKKLRDKTGLSMMDCKKALTESDNDEAKALDWLKEKYGRKALEKGDRATGEGRIGSYVHDDRHHGGLVELRCETAPVAKNQVFIELADLMAHAVCEQPKTEVTGEEIKGLEVEGKKIADEMNAVFSKLQENMTPVKAHKVEGAFVQGYVHHTGTIGVMVALDAMPHDLEVASDLCMHIAAMKPKAWTRDQVPTAEVEEFRAAAREEAIASGKPENIVDKIVDGKMNAFYAERVLPEQEHVNPKYERKSVMDTLKAQDVNEILDVVIYQVGVD